MRLTFFSALVTVSFVISACGSNGDGSSGGGTSNNGGGGSPLSPKDCESAWTSYVKSHPRGLKLRYETRGMGRIDHNSTEVTESNENAVTESHTYAGNTSSTTITKAEWLKSCNTTSEGPSELPTSATIEANRKEIKATRAGLFNTNYVRMRMTQDSGQTPMVTVTETWTNDEELASFMVYTKTTMTSDSYTMETTSELISLERP